MEHKYQLGDEVSIEFIGKVVGVNLSGDEIQYAVDGDGAYGVFARRVKESQLYSLSKPEAVK